jgi:L-threonylcarbamoyladenylate synthase
MVLSDGKEGRERAASVLRAGGIVAFRTDTFYGLGADPLNRDALRAINALKGREGGKPILLVISDEKEAARFFAVRTSLMETVIQKYWPGALTIVAAARAEVPEELTAGTGTIGVRLPLDEGVRDFVRACGGALTATSANLAGEAPARNALEVARSFPEGIDLIVDGGAATGDKPSTVLDLCGAQPRVLREGAISLHELREVLRAE